MILCYRTLFLEEYVVKLKDLNKATSIGQYQISVHFNYIETTILDFEEKDGLQLNPDFQRGHVWTKEQQVSFIEFIINNPTKRQILYFNISDWGNEDMVLVDGLQRLTALRLFLSDRLEVYGKKFTEFEDHKIFNGKYFIEFNVNNLQTRKEVLKWYIEINKGGTPHTDEELDRVSSMLAVL